MSSLTILYGTQGGTSELLAYRLGRYALLGGAQRVRVLEADQVSVEQWTSLSPIVLVCSNANQGDAPLSIRNTWRTLLSSDAPFLDGLFFAVFGVGDSLYEKFNYMPKMLHNRLVLLHAVPLCYRGLGDESDPHGIEEALVPWVKELWTTLGWGSIFSTVSSSSHPLPPSPLTGAKGGPFSLVRFASLHALTDKALPLFPLYITEVHSRKGEAPLQSSVENSSIHYPSTSPPRLGEKKGRDTSPSFPPCRSPSHFVGEVVENQRITAEDHFQAVHHLKLALSCAPRSFSPPSPSATSSSTSSACSPILEEKRRRRNDEEKERRALSLPTFLPGDALGVFVPNRRAQVDLALEVLGYTGEEEVIVKPRHVSYEERGEEASVGPAVSSTLVTADAATGKTEYLPEGIPCSSSSSCGVRHAEQGEDQEKSEESTSPYCSSLGFEEHTFQYVYHQCPMSLRHLLTYYVDLDAVVSQDFLWMLSRLVVDISATEMKCCPPTAPGRHGNHGRSRYTPTSEQESDALHPAVQTFLTTSDHQMECARSDVSLHNRKENQEKLSQQWKAIQEQAKEIRERLLELADPGRPDGYLSYAHREKRNVVETLLDFSHSATVAPPLGSTSGMKLLQRVPLDLFLSFSTWMRPRYYSISSSPTLDGGTFISTSSSPLEPRPSSYRLSSKDRHPSDSHTEHYMVHLTVARLDFTTPLKRVRAGLCSTALTSSTAGTRFECCRWEGSLVVPDYPLPLVCIATGSGIAPVRCVLREWASKAAERSVEAEEFRKTPVYLFFGCRNERKDFLYSKEWEELQSSKTLMPNLQVIPAFSRDGAKKVYVSHQLGEHANLIGDLLLRHLKDKEEDSVSPPVVVYVCGNAKQMPKDVARTLRDILIEKLKRKKIEKYKNRLSQEKKDTSSTEKSDKVSSQEEALMEDTFRQEAEKEANLLLQAMHYEGRYQVDTWST